MSPSIRDGDLVLTARLWLGSSVGDVVLVKRSSDGQLLLHRVIEEGEGPRRPPTREKLPLRIGAEQHRSAHLHASP